ncbi:hypothetical protein L6452_02357 [Arctium lappa]|uniref:Uncharacterized protein n=1 Tax=Arctium lappa TaxID=4217 RepID=A0ACB9FK79_ARCLA|nr:hypothetical protein L6452_02357 [Arctium lappa]
MGVDSIARKATTPLCLRTAIGALDLADCEKTSLAEAKGARKIVKTRPACLSLFYFNPPPPPPPHFPLSLTIDWLCVYPRNPSSPPTPKMA